MENDKKPYRIIFNDEYLLAVEKAPNLLVVPTPEKETHTLTNLLCEEFLKKEKIKVYPCHRIDRTTSGLILYAKTKELQDYMMNEFRARRIRKKYVAFVHGRIPLKGTLRSYIRDHYNRFERKEKFAITKYILKNQYRDFCVIEIETLTGRTNQIRIQFSQIGNPLVGERKFAIAKNYPVKFSRPALHASYLEFTHPISRQRVTLVSRIFPDMQEFLSRYQ